MRGLVSSHTLRVVIAHAICACVTLAAVASAKAQDAAITLAIRQATAASLAKKYDLAIEIYSGALRIDDLSPSERRDLLRRRALENESANKQVESEADWKAAIAVEPVGGPWSCAAGGGVRGSHRATGRSGRDLLQIH